ncbi:hypothetical protein V1527DRAFT_461268 [Lipomyces starkeyi]
MDLSGWRRSMCLSILYALNALCAMHCCDGKVPRQTGPGGNGGRRGRVSAIKYNTVRFGVTGLTMRRDEPQDLGGGVENHKRTRMTTMSEPKPRASFSSNLVKLSFPTAGDHRHRKFLKCGVARTSRTLLSLQPKQVLCFVSVDHSDDLYPESLV